MRERLPENLLKLADACPLPLYAVGGSVRDYLRGALSNSPDWDIASPCPEQRFLEAAHACGFRETAVYPRTGTVKLKDGAGVAYEFTRFRSDEYERGVHRPSRIAFTDDIAVDARRRDFCANAVYFEIKGGKFCDPLGGMADIEARVLRTVAPAEKVFGEDGLRLMRLARVAAQTGFSPDGECLAGAKANAALIDDIAPERVLTELDLLLHADERSGDGDAPYRGLCLLRETGVLARILPELALGDGMPQRADFHDHDVLEHSLRCVRYAAPEVRYAALLHDAGKPLCFVRDGNFHAHPEEGARIAEAVLTRLKAPKKLIRETHDLVLLHMRDYNLQMRESKVRRCIAEHYPILPKLLLLKQADYAACKDETGKAPAVEKWERILAKMRAEGVPFTLGELAVKGDDLFFVPPERRAEALHALLIHCAQDGALNGREHLLKLARSLYTEEI